MLEKRLQLDEGSLEAEDQKEKVRNKVLNIIGSAVEAQLERRKQEVEEPRLDEKERRKRKRLANVPMFACNGPERGDG